MITFGTSSLTVSLLALFLIAVVTPGCVTARRLHTMTRHRQLYNSTAFSSGSVCSFPGGRAAVIAGSYGPRGSLPESYAADLAGSSLASGVYPLLDTVNGTHFMPGVLSEDPETEADPGRNPGCVACNGSGPALVMVAGEGTKVNNFRHTRFTLGKHEWVSEVVTSDFGTFRDVKCVASKGANWGGVSAAESAWIAEEYAAYTPGTPANAERNVTYDAFPETSSIGYILAGGSVEGDWVQMRSGLSPSVEAIAGGSAGYVSLVDADDGSSVWDMVIDTSGEDHVIAVEADQIGGVVYILAQVQGTSINAGAIPWSRRSASSPGPYLVIIAANATNGDPIRATSIFEPDAATAGNPWWVESCGHAGCAEGPEEAPHDRNPATGDLKICPAGISLEEDGVHMAVVFEIGNSGGSSWSFNSSAAASRADYPADATRTSNGESAIAVLRLSVESEGSGFWAKRISAHFALASTRAKLPIASYLTALPATGLVTIAVSVRNGTDVQSPPGSSIDSSVKVIPAGSDTWSSGGDNTTVCMFMSFSWDTGSIVSTSRTAPLAAISACEVAELSAAGNPTNRWSSARPTRLLVAAGHAGVQGFPADAAIFGGTSGAVGNLTTHSYAAYAAAEAAGTIDASTRAIDPVTPFIGVIDPASGLFVDLASSSSRNDGMNRVNESSADGVVTLINTPYSAAIPVRVTGAALVDPLAFGTTMVVIGGTSPLGSAGYTDGVNVSAAADRVPLQLNTLVEAPSLKLDGSGDGYPGGHEEDMLPRSAFYTVWSRRALALFPNTTIVTDNTLSSSIGNTEWFPVRLPTHIPLASRTVPTNFHFRGIDTRPYSGLDRFFHVAVSGSERDYCAFQGFFAKNGTTHSYFFPTDDVLFTKDPSLTVPVSKLGWDTLDDMSFICPTYDHFHDDASTGGTFFTKPFDLFVDGDGSLFGVPVRTAHFEVFASDPDPYGFRYPQADPYIYTVREDATTMFQVQLKSFTHAYVNITISITDELNATGAYLEPFEQRNMFARGFDPFESSGYGDIEPPHDLHYFNPAIGSNITSAQGSTIWMLIPGIGRFPATNVSFSGTFPFTRTFGLHIPHWDTSVDPFLNYTILDVHARASDPAKDPLYADLPLVANLTVVNGHSIGLSREPYLERRPNDRDTGADGSARYINFETSYVTGNGYEPFVGELGMLYLQSEPTADVIINVTVIIPEIMDTPLQCDEGIVVPKSQWRGGDPSYGWRFPCLIPGWRQLPNFLDRDVWPITNVTINATCTSADPDYDGYSETFSDIVAYKVVNDPSVALVSIGDAPESRIRGMGWAPQICIDGVNGAIAGDTRCLSGDSSIGDYDLVYVGQEGATGVVSVFRMAPERSWNLTIVGCTSLDTSVVTCPAASQFPVAISNDNLVDPAVLPLTLIADAVTSQGYTRHTSVSLNISHPTNGYRLLNISVTVSDDDTKDRDIGVGWMFSSEGYETPANGRAGSEITEVLASATFQNVSVAIGGSFTVATRLGSRLLESISGSERNGFVAVLEAGSSDVRWAWSIASEAHRGVRVVSVACDPTTAAVFALVSVTRHGPTSEQATKIWFENSPANISVTVEAGLSHMYLVKYGSASGSMAASSVGWTVNPVSGSSFGLISPMRLQKAAQSDMVLFSGTFHESALAFETAPPTGSDFAISGFTIQGTEPIPILSPPHTVDPTIGDGFACAIRASDGSDFVAAVVGGPQRQEVSGGVSPGMPANSIYLAGEITHPGSAESTDPITFTPYTPPATAGTALTHLPTVGFKRQMYVAKMAASGTSFEWALTTGGCSNGGVGGGGSSDGMNVVGSASNGNGEQVYVLGDRLNSQNVEYVDVWRITPSAPGCTLVLNQTISQLDPYAGTFWPYMAQPWKFNGPRVWVYMAHHDGTSGFFSWSDNTMSKAMSIAVESTTGSVYVMGSYFGSFSWGADTSLPHTKEWETFLVALNPLTGKAIWAESGGGYNSDVRATSLSLGAQGAAYITGTYYSDNVFFGDYNVTKSSYTLADSFVTKFSKPDIIVDRRLVHVTEGAPENVNSMYSLWLRTPPHSDVSITVIQSSPPLTVNPTTLVFSTANWNIPQTVKVAAEQNTYLQVDRSFSIDHSVTSSDLAYNQLGVATVKAVVHDHDDDPGTIDNNGGGLYVDEPADPISFSFASASVTSFVGYPQRKIADFLSISVPGTPLANVEIVSNSDTTIFADPPHFVVNAAGTLGELRFTPAATGLTGIAVVTVRLRYPYAGYTTPDVTFSVSVATPPGPLVTSVVPEHGAYAGGDLIVVYGSGFGNGVATPGTAESNTTTIDIAGIPCAKASTVWVSDTEVRCLSAPPATGNGSDPLSGPVSVSVSRTPPLGGSMTSALPTAPKFTYVPTAVVTTVTPAEGPAKVASMPVTLEGSHLCVSASDVLSITVGGSVPCALTKWVNASRLECTLGAATDAIVADGGGPLAIIVSCSSAGAGINVPGVSAQYTYLTSHAVAVIPSYAAADANATVTIAVDNFPQSGPAGGNATDDVVTGIFLAGRPCLHRDALTAADPTALSGVPISSRSCTTEELNAVNVATVGKGTPRATLGCVDCVAMADLSDGVATQAFTTGKNVTGGVAVTTSLGGGSLFVDGSAPGPTDPSPSDAALSMAPTFVYIPLGPVITSVQPTTALASGGTLVTLLGRNFGRAPSTVSVDLIGFPCTSVTRVSSAELVCVTPDVSSSVVESSALTGRAKVTVNPSGLSGASPDGIVFVFAGSLAAIAPHASAVVPERGSIIGGYRGVVLGHGFGTEDESMVTLMRFGGKNCLSSMVYTSPTKISCIVPYRDAVPSTPVGVFVETSAGVSDFIPKFTYHYPSAVIDGIHPRLVTVNGGDDVTIIGAWFGDSAGDVSISVSISGAICDGVKWISVSEVSCTTPPMSSTSLVATGDATAFTIVAGGDIAANAKDLGLRYAAENLICRPGCGFNAECVAGSCVCNPGFVGPPNCLDSIVAVTLPPSMEVSEEGSTTPVGVSLRAQPSSDVVFIAQSTDASEGLLSLPGTSFSPYVSLSFSSSDWSITKTIDVKGVYDAMRDGDTQFGIRFHETVSSDARFHSHDPPDIGTIPILVLAPDISGSTKGAKRQRYHRHARHSSPSSHDSEHRRHRRRRELQLALATPLSSSMTTISASTTLATNFVNREASGKILSVSPELTQLNGTAMTVQVADLCMEGDIRLKFYINNEGGTATDAAIDTSISPYEVLVVNRTKSVKRVDDTLQFSKERVFPDGSRDSLAVPVHEISFKSPAMLHESRYVDVSVSCTEPSGVSETNITRSTPLSNRVYFLTDDCPTEGMYGRGEDCRPCPEGGQCPGGYRIWPKDGFWNPGEDSGYVVECRPRSRCRGGPESACYEGYKGEVCAECADGYVAVGEICEECPEPEGYWSYFIANLIIWGLITLSAWFLEDREQMSLVLAAVISFQNIAAVGQAIDDSMPSFVVSTYSFLVLFAGDVRFVKASCLTGHIPVGPDYFVALAYNAAMGIPMIFGTLVVRFFSVRYHKAHNTGRAEERADFWMARFKRVCLVHITIVWFSVLSQTLSVISCFRVGDGDVGGWRLITRPDYSCFTSKHVGIFVPAVLVLIFFCAAYPLGYAYYVMIKHKSILFDEGKEAGLFVNAFDVLYEPFSENQRWFWIFEFIVSTVLALADTSLTRLPIIGYVLVALALVVQLVWILVHPPFRRQFENYLVMLVTGANIVGSTAIFLAKEANISKTTWVVLIWIMIGLLAIDLVCVSFVMVHYVIFNNVKSKFAKNGRSKMPIGDDSSLPGLEGDLGSAPSMLSLDSQAAILPGGVTEMEEIDVAIKGGSNSSTDGGVALQESEDGVFDALGRAASSMYSALKNAVSFAGDEHEGGGISGTRNYHSSNSLGGTIGATNRTNDTDSGSAGAPPLRPVPSANPPALRSDSNHTLPIPVSESQTSIRSHTSSTGHT